MVKIKTPLFDSVYRSLFIVRKALSVIHDIQNTHAAIRDTTNYGAIINGYTNLAMAPATGEIILTNAGQKGSQVSHAGDDQYQPPI